MQQQPVADNPYAPEGGTQGPPGRRRRFGKGPGIATALVFLLLAAGGGLYAVNDGRPADPRPPVAEQEPRASGEPSADPTPAVRTPGTRRMPTSQEINAHRAPGDATAWIVNDPTDVPRRSIEFHDLWIVGDTVVQAVYRKVSAHRLSDGAEVWSVPLPAPVCETPVNPTPDGKVVLAYKSSQAVHGNRCNQLQMIDLRTGKAGWHKELTETGPLDDTITVNTAISGDVLAVVQGMRAATYRVGDGTKLYDIPMENPGRCHPDDVAGGPRLLVKSDCAIDVDRGKSYSQLREIDPRTGTVLWRHRTAQGWQVGKVLSADPVVITTFHAEERTDNWRVVALGPGGRPRTTVDARPKGFTYCAGEGSSDENLQNCGGAAVGDDTVFLGGTDRVGAYDLGTGKLVWGVKSEDTALHPLRAEGGESGALVYEAASPSRPGGIVRLGKGGADTKRQVLRHPASARATEAGMLAGRVAWTNDRIVITPSVVYGDDARSQSRMLSFGPER
ncbi:outer membrane protein assembly factor BamB family protein [Streptomyces sp. NPDC054847]